MLCTLAYQYKVMACHIYFNSKGNSYRLMMEKTVNELSCKKSINKSLVIASMLSLFKLSIIRQSIYFADWKIITQSAIINYMYNQAINILLDYIT